MSFGKFVLTKNYPGSGTGTPDKDSAPSSFKLPSFASLHNDAKASNQENAAGAAAMNDPHCVQIGENRHLTVELSECRTYVQVMRTFSDFEMQSKPDGIRATRICLTKASIDLLLAGQDAVLEQGKRMELGVGGEIRLPLALKNFLIIEEGAICAHLRKYFQPSNSSEWFPSRTGVTLRNQELINLIRALSGMVSQLEEYA